VPNRSPRVARKTVGDRPPSAALRRVQQVPRTARCFLGSGHHGYDRLCRRGEYSVGSGSRPLIISSRMEDGMTRRIRPAEARHHMHDLRIAIASLVLAASVSAITLPAVRFTDTKLKNGLRLIVAEDHTAPVFSIAVVYDVGS